MLDLDYVLEENTVPPTIEDHTESELSFLMNQVTDGTTFVNNIDDLLRFLFKDFDNTEEILMEVLDPNVPNRFIIFKRGEQRYYIKNSTILWMLTLVQHKVPKDRVLRFVSTSNKQIVQENLQSGDFVLMEIDNDEKICLVQGFVQKSAKKAKKCNTQQQYHESERIVIHSA